MTTREFALLIDQIHSLKQLMPVYSGKTIDNILSQLQARLKEAEVESNIPQKEST